MKFIASFLLCFWFVGLIADPNGVGSTWTLLKFLDQRENTWEVRENTRLILAFEMDASKFAHEYFEKMTDEDFKKSNLLFISDIHKMPGLITSFVALPKMRSYSYPISLIREDKSGESVPKQKGKLTYIELSDFKIKKIEYLSNFNELKKAIEGK
jgi:hypothetical protein